MKWNMSVPNVARKRHTSSVHLESFLSWSQRPYEKIKQLVPRETLDTFFVAALEFPHLDKFEHINSYLKKSYIKQKSVDSEQNEDLKKNFTKFLTRVYEDNSYISRANKQDLEKKKLFEDQYALTAHAAYELEEKLFNRFFFEYLMWELTAKNREKRFSNKFTSVKSYLTSYNDDKKSWTDIVLEVEKHSWETSYIAVDIKTKNNVANAEVENLRKMKDRQDSLEKSERLHNFNHVYLTDFQKSIGLDRQPINLMTVPYEPKYVLPFVAEYMKNIFHGENSDKDVLESFKDSNKRIRSESLQKATSHELAQVLNRTNERSVAKKSVLPEKISFNYDNDLRHKKYIANGKRLVKVLTARDRKDVRLEESWPRYINGISLSSYPKNILSSELYKQLSKLLSEPTSSPEDITKIIWDENASHIASLLGPSASFDSLDEYFEKIWYMLVWKALEDKYRLRFWKDYPQIEFIPSTSLDEWQMKFISASGESKTINIRFRENSWSNQEPYLSLPWKQQTVDVEYDPLANNFMAVNYLSRVIRWKETIWSWSFWYHNLYSYCRQEAKKSKLKDWRRNIAA